MPHASHQVLDPDPAGRRERVPRVTQIVKCKPRRPMASTACFQPVIRLKLLRRSGAPFAPVNTKAVGSGPTYTARCSRSTGMTAAGMPTARPAARDFNGPSVILLPGIRRSENATRTRTRPASSRKLATGQVSTPKQAKFLAVRFAHEALNPRDAGARWCSATMLRDLSPLLSGPYNEQDWS